MTGRWTEGELVVALSTEHKHGGRPKSERRGLCMPKPRGENRCLLGSLSPLLLLEFKFFNFYESLIFIFKF